jgi:MFS family permease
MDFAGTIVLVFFLGPLILGLALGGGLIPFGSVVSNILFAVALIALIVLIFIIRKKGGNAIIPSTAFADKNTVCLFLAFFLTSFANMFVFFFLPAYIMRVMQPANFGLTPALWSGITVTLFSIFPLFLSPVFGKMISKARNARTVSLFNVISRIVLLSCLLLFLKPDTSIWLLMVFTLIPGGVYSTTQSMCYAAGVQIMAPAKLRTQSNALVQMGQTFGSSPAIAIGGVLIGIFGFVDGLPIGFTIALVACVIGIIPSLLLKAPPEEA